ncbi:alpha/beta fold hydrolase [Actinomadura chibensis]|uniref:Alpha/beta hydrolase n=1 Tax=Actinomadura chibensis TaxID=392828 RepID=A0A5D0NUE0_9ACTN|nr:alpha/beta hydrolase [Actinomadura chibensis]TYB48005.1 alpha/beta hydrolase [Actinomadura chibensis]
MDVRHHTVRVNGLDVFYREAGDPAKPVLVLLHGFPTSSAMYRDLLRDLADDFHLVAPDYIGFGQSAMPSVDEFDYSFDSLAEVTLGLLDALRLDRFAIYVQDYGAPIGLRIASRHPERITAIVTQNGNAYEDGFTPFWDVLFEYYKDRETHEPTVAASLSLEAIHWQYTHGVPADRLDRVSPDSWTLDMSYLDRPGNKEIQVRLFWLYQTNIAAYPAFQEYFRTHRPPMLIAWGRNDEIFGVEGARAYTRDLPDAELHLLDAGHFALETHGREIAALIRGFLPRALA